MSGPNEKKEQRGGFGGAAQGRAAANSAASVFGIAVILVAVNYLSNRHYARADWTASQIYTLSDKSLKVVRGLDRPVRMIAMWSQADERFPDVKELLDRYAAASPDLSVEVVDPDLDPNRVQLLIDRYGAKMVDVGGVLGVEAAVIVVCGDDVKFVHAGEFESFDSADLYGLEGGGDKEGISGYRAEQALTSAVLTVSAKEQHTVCFTQGHDEWMYEGYGARALGHLKTSLTQDGYKTQAVAVTDKEPMHAGCDAVLVIGPTKAFLSGEGRTLAEYVRAGGRLGLFLDPVMKGETFTPTGLEPVAAGLGIVLGRDIVFETDPRRLVGPSPLTFVASEMTGHGAVKHLRLPEGVGEDLQAELGAYPVVFATARSLGAVEAAEVVAEPLARSSSKSWGETEVASILETDKTPERGDEDVAGPVTVAMASAVGTGKSEPKEGRLVVVGDADVLDEQLFVNAGLSNRDFWAGIVGWLSQRGELISLTAKNPEHVRLNLTDDEWMFMVQAVGGEILFFIVLGIVVWLRRRS